MCGIFGSPNITPEVRRMLPYLAQAMENRGRHAWGASNGTEIIKRLGTISSTWYEEYTREIHDWDAGIFHTRLASEGASDVVANAHPFKVSHPDGRGIIGIHNGQIYNHTELNQNHGRSCVVDSEHLWLHRAEGKGWKDLRGYAALAWWEQTEIDGEMEMYLSRINSTFLQLVKVKDGGVVWCSTREAINTAADWAGTEVTHKWELKEGEVYHLLSNGDVFSTDEFQTFGHYSHPVGAPAVRRNTDNANTPPTVPTGGGSPNVIPFGGRAGTHSHGLTNTNYGDPWDDRDEFPITRGTPAPALDFCYSCVHRVNLPGMLFCKECFGALLEGFNGVTQEIAGAVTVGDIR